VPAANQALKYAYFSSLDPVLSFLFIFTRRVGQPSLPDTFVKDHICEIQHKGCVPFNVQSAIQRSSMKANGVHFWCSCFQCSSGFFLVISARFTEILWI
jgi:hypothetical protein